MNFSWKRKYLMEVNLPFNQLKPFWSVFMWIIMKSDVKKVNWPKLAPCALMVNSTVR